MDQDVVRWVPSQSPNPALQAFMREAERDINARPTLSDPDVVVSTRTTLLPSAHRKPPTTARSAQPAHAPQEEEPEAAAFVELLKDAFKQLDENSLKKQRLAARAKENHRERTRGGDTRSLNAHPLTKTLSASAICSASLSTRTSTAFDRAPRGRAPEKTSSGVDLALGKSTPPSLSSHSLNPKPASAPQLPLRASTSNPQHSTARINTRNTNDNSSMQDVLDLTQTDTVWDRPTSTFTIQLDDDDSDSGMDISFLHPHPPPPTRVPAPTPKPNPRPSQPTTASRIPAPAPIQRTRTGPPLLGMRRGSYLPPSQHSTSQNTKSTTVPRFKPPLLTNTATSTNKSGSGSRPTTTTSARPPPRATVTKAAVVPKAAPENQDPDSSFDVSFDMDVDALEEAMKAYD